jgi:hypothetical protein
MILRLPRCVCFVAAFLAAAAPAALAAVVFDGVAAGDVSATRLQSPHSLCSSIALSCQWRSNRCDSKSSSK